MQALKDATQFRLLPVVVIDRPEDGLPLAEALMAGGLPVAEVTFRTEAAEEAIRLMARRFPDMLVGAGTVLTADQAERAMAAGARFLVAPGYNPANIEFCAKRAFPFIPGVNSPSGIEVALANGLKLLKFFPAEASGGLKFIDAVSQPYREARFAATGGINTANLASYLKRRAVAACGGSWMVDPKLIRTRNFTAIARLTADAMRLVAEATAAGVQVRSHTE